MREEIVEPAFQSTCFSVWLLYVKRCTVFFAFRRVILFPCTFAEGKTAHCCFAVGGTAPSRRLNAWDLIFQELIKSDGFNPVMGKYTLSALCPVTPHLPAVPNPSCFTVGVKPAQAYLVAHGKMFWKEQVGGREVRISSPTRLGCSLKHHDIWILSSTLVAKWVNKHIENKDRGINTRVRVHCTNDLNCHWNKGLEMLSISKEMYTLMGFGGYFSFRKQHLVSELLTCQ